MQNSSVSGGGAAGPSRISPQNGQNLVTNSVSSHRPLHERETIEREIRKHSYLAEQIHTITIMGW